MVIKGEEDDDEDDEEDVEEASWALAALRTLMGSGACVEASNKRAAPSFACVLELLLPAPPWELEVWGGESMRA